MLKDVWLSPREREVGRAAEVSREFNDPPFESMDGFLDSMILPPLIHSSNERNSFVNALSLPSSRSRPPPFLFHIFAISSSTLSPRPSSLHPDPQYFPINVASCPNAEEVKVRLCFFVMVRNAMGLRV